MLSSTMHTAKQTHLRTEFANTLQPGFHLVFVAIQHLPANKQRGVYEGQQASHAIMGKSARFMVRLSQGKSKKQALP